MGDLSLELASSHFQGGFDPLSFPLLRKHNWKQDHYTSTFVTCSDPAELTGAPLQF